MIPCYMDNAQFRGMLVSDAFEGKNAWKSIDI